KGGKAESYAGRFSAKEAISKALGTGVRGFNLVDIEILNNSLGKPEVTLLGELKKRDIKVEVSISHCKTYATAVAIIMEREKNDRIL
ncbi:MAG: holo-ACP synthase, partial [Cetobacterium sp.]